MQTERVTILGIPFDRLTLTGTLKIIQEKLGKPADKPIMVATPNPEMLLAARKNKAFTKILQNTNLNIADGTGIIWASKVIKNPLPERVTGTDLMQAICANVSRDIRIFLLGGAPGVAKKAQEKLSQESHANIVGTYDCPADPSHDKAARAIINAAKPDVVFVAFGAPKQELWLERNLPHLQTVKLAMGVGGAFDFIAGIRKRAPAWMQKLGLEWLFRLLQQPSRIRRIWNATIVFPIVFLFSKRDTQT
jgi:N-acetylglucosaminyldiphosphoundecaprenol N-acetyl-beta-D-mannosaminyltransferase